MPTTESNSQVSVSQQPTAGQSDDTDAIPSTTLPPASADSQTVRYTITLPSDPASVPKARRYAMDHAARHPRRDDIGTSTSELVSNAILYGSGGRVTLDVEVNADDVVVTVTNRTSGTHPRVSDANGLDPIDAWEHEHGRGLQVVSAMGETSVTVSTVIPHVWKYPQGVAGGA